MPPKKPAERRQNRATKDTVVELVPAGVVPAAPEHWLDETVAEWDLFWRDGELLSVVRESHRSAVGRLFELRDRQLRAWAEAEAFRAAVGADHLVPGSKGQMVANPLYALAEKAEGRALQIEGRIEALEDRFGLTPGSLLKLGVDFQRKQNLEATNARMMEALGRVGVGGSSDPHDPRAVSGDAAVEAS